MSTFNTNSVVSLIAEKQQVVVFFFLPENQPSGGDAICRAALRRLIRQMGLINPRGGKKTQIDSWSP